MIRMTKQEFENKLYNKNFSQEELENLLWLNYQCTDDELDLQGVDEIKDAYLDRWSRPAGYIFTYNNEFFRIDYDEGLTEYQENCNFSQPYKVQKTEKQITITEWEEIKDAN